MMKVSPRKIKKQFHKMLKYMQKADDYIEMSESNASQYTHYRDLFVFSQSYTDGAIKRLDKYIEHIYHHGYAK